MVCKHTKQQCISYARGLMNKYSLLQWERLNQTPQLPKILQDIHQVKAARSVQSKKNLPEADPKNIAYTVKVINTSFDKVLLRYQTDDLSYTFRFVDPQNTIRFTMNGNLILQYSLTDYDNAKIIKIKQDTLINVKQNDIIIDDLPPEDKLKPEETKSLEKVK